jgi:putative ABC transport system permease protein
MKLPLAWLNLLHERARTAVAIAGVAFAVVLILMQLGFFGSVQQTATRIYDQLEFDLLLTSPQYLHLSVPGKFPRTRLYQAASTEGVASRPSSWTSVSTCGAIPKRGSGAAS